jgi:glycerol-3-phosphate dehydrogenase subunit C
VPSAAVRVLERNGYEVRVPRGRTCCGMPNLDGGDVAGAQRKMAQNIASLVELVRAGNQVVVPGPTCSYTMRKEWPTYVPGADADAVAANTLDLMEFLDRLRKNGSLNRDFQGGLGKIAYHAACHLRAQKIALPGARVLSQLPNTEVHIVERCSAVDGTWGMKAAFYEEGVRYGRKLARALESEEHDLVVSDCSLAGLRIFKETGEHALHPIEALARAYGV